MTELGITKIGYTISDTGRFLGSDNTCMEAAMVDVMIATSERIYNEFKRNGKTASVFCLKDRILVSSIQIYQLSGNIDNLSHFLFLSRLKSGNFNIKYGTPIYK